jgi:DNA-directed RNA polymerase specialized sigma24 family protein
MPDHITTWLSSALFEPWLTKTLRAQPGCPGLTTDAFDDLAQQCRLRIWSRRERFARRPTMPLTALARKIVQSVVLDHLRCVQKRHERLVEVDDPDLDLSWERLFGLSGHETDRDPTEAVPAVLAQLAGDEAHFTRLLQTGLSVRDAGRAIGWGWRKAEKARDKLALRLRWAGLPGAAKGVARG